MTSKLRHPVALALTETRRSALGESMALPTHASNNRLVRRIARALRVPEAALYERADASAPHPRDRDVAEDRDCAALLAAYRRIDDPATRRSLLTLVEEAAGRAETVTPGPRVLVPARRGPEDRAPARSRTSAPSPDETA